MVGASDVDSSSAYSTSSSSSSDYEGDHRKGRKSSKNLSGLTCLARDDFCRPDVLQDPGIKACRPQGGRLVSR
jgi:hypothetical protein